MIPAATRPTLYGRRSRRVSIATTARDQKQKSAGLEIEFHALSYSPRFASSCPRKKTKATQRRNSDW